MPFLSTVRKMSNTRSFDIFVVQCFLSIQNDTMSYCPRDSLRKSMKHIYRVTFTLHIIPIIYVTFLY